MKIQTDSIGTDGAETTSFINIKESPHHDIVASLYGDGTFFLTSEVSSSSTDTTDFKIDKNFNGVGTNTNKALYIDFDATGIVASGRIQTNIGLDLDINTNSPTHVGTVRNTGLDIDLVAGTSGAQYNTGIDIDVDGADSNIGLLINTAGTHIKLEANADTDDYATFAVADTGDLTIATVGDGTTDSDLHLDADGIIKIDAAPVGTSDSIQFIMDGNVSAAFQHHHSATYLRLYENGGASATDYIDIAWQADGKTLIQTVDTAGEDAHLVFYVDGHVEFGGTGVGFDLQTPTYNASDTNVDFREGNMQFVTFGSGNITDLNLKFPAVSGNL